MTFLSYERRRGYAPERLDRLMQRAHRRALWRVAQLFHNSGSPSTEVEKLRCCPAR